MTDRSYFEEFCRNLRLALMVAEGAGETDAQKILDTAKNMTAVAMKTMKAKTDER